MSMEESTLWRKNLPLITKGKCKGCPTCAGYGCKDELPGMGGLGSGESFINNVISWQSLYQNLVSSNKKLPDISNLKIGLAPVTGVDENMGSPNGLDEKQFLSQLIESALKAGCDISIGDGTPDYKLLYGIEGLKKFNAKGNVFIKPYEDKKIFKRIEWASEVANYIGIDIDAASIVTMANKASLEQKSLSSLRLIKKQLNKNGIPFVLKGIHTLAMVELVKELKPDVAYVSNHGGRVTQNCKGIGFFLKENSSIIKANSGDLWVDSGLREREDLLVAYYYGATSTFTGRMAIQYVGAFGVDGIKMMLKHQYRLDNL